jgi:ribulose-5-phosphate 4-epimerase/fuculose-1-phosphate aldolase
VAPAQADPDVDRLKEQIARYSIKAYERGLVGGAGGNVSARLPGREEIFITRTGVILGEVTPDDVVRIDPQGRPLDSEAPKPSKEVPFHTVVYRLRPDVNAIIHLHPCYTVVQSLRLADLPLLTVSARLSLGPRVPCVPVAYAGTRLLAQYVGAALKEAPGAKVLLLAAHGLNALAADLATAYALADLTEFTAKQACIADSLQIHLALPPREALPEPDAAGA